MPADVGFGLACGFESIGATGSNEARPATLSREIPYPEQLLLAHLQAHVGQTTNTLLYYVTHLPSIDTKTSFDMSKTTESKTPEKEALDENFWGQEILSGRMEQWNSQARLKRLRWRLIIKMAHILKRLLDIVGSICALIISSPIFFITALAIKLDDGGPILFKQIRVGEGGKLFKIWKFRSMVLNADKIKDEILESNQHADGVTFKMKDDPRITKPGKWIRKLSIDEFPQFINVLKGDMSLVGPRPPVPREVALYGARHLRRLRAKPGITCLWQIGGRADIDFEGQVRLDLEYIHSQSLWQDILILLKTVPAVLLGKGAY